MYIHPHADCISIGGLLLSQGYITKRKTKQNKESTSDTDTIKGATLSNIIEDAMMEAKDREKWRAIVQNPSSTNVSE